MERRAIGKKKVRVLCQEEAGANNRLFFFFNFKIVFILERDRKSMCRGSSR